jgi:hypothetical protein
VRQFGIVGELVKKKRLGGLKLAFLVALGAYLFENHKLPRSDLEEFYYG